MWLQVLQTLIIPYNINHLFAHSEVVTSIANTNLFYLILIIFLHTVKWLQVFLPLIIPFNINHLFAHSEVVTSIAYTNHSI